jgi:serine/threonine protein kinase
MNNRYSSLFENKKDSEYEGKTYKYLGKGGTGVVYKIKEDEQDYAIKIIPKKKYNDKEYKIGLYLNNILNIDSINFVRIYDKIETESFVVLKMDYIPGKFTDWIIKKNSEKHSDKEWILCILQIIISLRILQQKINLFHRDMKPKNILFKTVEEPIEFEYENPANNKKYKINTSTIFYITDFAHSISNLSKEEEQDNSYENEDNDLFEIKNIPQRLKVDKLMKEYKFNELYKIASKNPHFAEYYNEEKKKIEQKLKSYPAFIKEKHLARNITYFILENNLIKVDLSNIMSKDIEYLFETLLDDDLDNIIDNIYKLL